jgi:(1->4)-alpha-D-glucan 1-alpha-D-glucosylmutase
VIAAVTRLCAPLSEQGRVWPRGEAFEGELHIDGYSLEGAGKADKSRVPLANLFRHLPVTALKAGYIGAAKPIAKTSRQFA